MDNSALIEAVTARICNELCENLVQERVPSWGPAEKHGSNGFIRSWTDTVSKNIGPTRHYITCSGDSNGLKCCGRWNRRERMHLPAGTYCIFGSHVFFNGTTISEIQSSSASEGRNLKRLRQLWTKHVLSSSLNEVGCNHHNGNTPPTDSLLSRDEIEKMRSFLQKTISRSSEAAKSSHGQKVLGQGAGGWAGLTETGIVLKRDTGLLAIGNHEDHCSDEPGGYFQTGDVEVWVTWHGWSSLTVRDGRWRPGFHLEILLFLLTTIVDYSASRELWRVRGTPWVIAAEWIWQETPRDVHRLFTEGIVKDLQEMYKREVGRLQNLFPSAYQADDCCDRETQYRLLLDRAGVSD